MSHSLPAAAAEEGGVRLPTRTEEAWLNLRRAYLRQEGGSRQDRAQAASNGANWCGNRPAVSSSQGSPNAQEAASRPARAARRRCATTAAAGGHGGPIAGCT